MERGDAADVDDADADDADNADDDNDDDDEEYDDDNDDDNDDVVDDDDATWSRSMEISTLEKREKVSSFISHFCLKTCERCFERKWWHGGTFR